MLKNITASVLALLLVATFGSVAAQASEITGSLLIQSGGSTQSGSLAVEVGGGGTSQTSGSRNGGDEAGGGGGGGSGRSGTRHGQVAIVSDPLIYIDTLPSGSESSGAGGSSVSAGTGGGFDRGLEEFLAASGDSNVTVDEAIAFNTAQNPFANTDLVAATADTGLGNAKIWTAVVLGLALLGLAGYAVSALISYRRENDL